MSENFDIIVVGAGHAGIEAALAGTRLYIAIPTLETRGNRNEGTVRLPGLDPILRRCDHTQRHSVRTGKAIRRHGS